MLALQIVDQRIWSTTSINARKTSATRGFMQGPVSSEPPIGPSPQHYHRHPVWELAIQGLQFDSKMLDAKIFERFNVETRDLKNFEPSCKHIFECRRNCGKKSVIKSPAFTDVVDQIHWSTICSASICGPLSVPVQTVPRAPFPHPWPSEAALLILIFPTFLGVW